MCLYSIFHDNIRLKYLSTSSFIISDKTFSLASPHLNNDFTSYNTKHSLAVEIFLNFDKYFLIVRFFNEWVEQVKAEIPAERLLVFEVKQGWGPLCRFLGVPEPQEPFPNMNDTAEQLQRLRAMKRISVLLWTAAVAGLGATAYYFKDSIKIPTLTFN